MASIEGQKVGTNELFLIFSKQLEEAFKRIEYLENEVADLKKNAGNPDADKVYTDRELYELKYEDNLSWKQLAKRTGKPVSTLQYRIRRYTDNC